MKPVSDYAAWQAIDYLPALDQLPLNSLDRFLSCVTNALEIGCNSGSSALTLARRGIRMVGVDINPSAIRKARDRAASEGLSEYARFESVDFARSPQLGVFDLVLLIRTLTCFPETKSWITVLRNAYAHLRPSGLLYVHDFMLAPELDDYARRYRDGTDRGWRCGNFAVQSPTGNLEFVAHHHSEEDLRTVTAPYRTMILNFHQSLSMNGHNCKMFEFLGRKVEPDLRTTEESSLNTKESI